MEVGGRLRVGQPAWEEWCALTVSPCCLRPPTAGLSPVMYRA